MMIDLPFIAVNSGTGTGTGGGGGGGDTIITGHVVTYANLPAASGYTGQYYIVDTNTGTWLLGTLKKAGLYKSNGTTWIYIDSVPETTSLSDGTTIITGTNIILEGTNGVVTTTDVNNNKITISGPNIPDQLSDLSDDSTHRLVTDTEKASFENKYDSSNFIAGTDYKPATTYMGSIASGTEQSVSITSAGGLFSLAGGTYINSVANAFSYSNGALTCLVSGEYLLNFSASIKESATSLGYLTVLKNGVGIPNSSAMCSCVNANYYYSVSGTVIVNLAIGDKLEFAAISTAVSTFYYAFAKMTAVRL